MTDRKSATAASRLFLPEYGWLLLPLVFAFLAFPLARVVLAGIAFVWVALLLFQRSRGVSYLRALAMTTLAMPVWVMLCALLTFLANDVFRWAGETFADAGPLIVTTLMFTFVVFASVAAAVTLLLRIAGWDSAVILFVCLMCMAIGAVAPAFFDSLWAFPIGTLAASVLLALFLAWKPHRSAGHANAAA